MLRPLEMAHDFLREVITDQDTVVDATMGNGHDPAFEAEFLQVDEDGDKVFKSMPCPFLGGDNLCSIYDVRPKACREFPSRVSRFFLTSENPTFFARRMTCLPRESLHL